jgi:glycosyltransferase involved in cell wall biosynthesis
MCVDRFFCLTPELAADVISSRIVPAHKVRRIVNGIDTALYRNRVANLNVRGLLGIPESAPVIGTVGRLATVKCQDLLLAAFADIKKIRTDAHLIVVGDGPLKEGLTRLAAQLGVESSVHFTGFQNDTVSFLRAMNVFTLTSQSEGTPQAALEAAVVGLPIVATNVGGIPEVVDDGTTGILFSPGDKSALTSALLRLVDDPDAARRMGMHGTDRICSVFDVERMAREYHEQFFELLGR